ncbi:hypothetical protein MGSAQ_000356, partial [marine sediment metagenome]
SSLAIAGIEAPSLAKTVLPVAVSKTDDNGGNDPRYNVKDAQPDPVQ